MRIAVSGSHGFVGTALVAHLAASGHEVVRLVRHGRSPPGTAAWEPRTGEIDQAALGHVDAFMHLAGENIGSGRWTPARRRRIAESRGPTTERLCWRLAAMDRKPAVFVSSSAIGFYGNRGDELLDEDSPPGRGFLADVCRDWEASTKPASDAGIRVVSLRTGMVVDPAGGALERMVPPFRLGLGGPFGSGRNWISWITRHDLVRAFAFAAANESLRGPVLAVSPSPVTNRGFTRELAAALHRPAFLRVPALLLRLVFGAMADEMLLASSRAHPRRLLAAGFTFDDPELGPALRRLLSR